MLSDTGMIASGHALASEAGIRILKSGGNAIDAAVAAWAVQGLTEPEMTGLGGDMFMLIYLAKTGEVKFINGTGVAPMAATVDFYKGKGGLPERRHPLGQRAGVGGRRGARGEDLRHQAARPNCWRPPWSSPIRGFPITESLAGAIRSSREKLSPSAKEIWFNGDTPLGFGDRVIQKDLAATLREIGAKGSAAFYQGPIAEKFAAYMKAEGGLIDQKDLAGIKANEDTPMHDQLQGHRRLTSARRTRRAS